MQRHLANELAAGAGRTVAHGIMTRRGNTESKAVTVGWVFAAIEQQQLHGGPVLTNCPFTVLKLMSHIHDVGCSCWGFMMDLRLARVIL